MSRGLVDDPLNTDVPQNLLSDNPSDAGATTSLSGGSNADGNTDFSGGLVNSVTGTIPPSAIRSGELPSLIGHGKRLFTDTTAGFLMGVDTDNIYKWIIGDSNSSADWAVTTPSTLTIKGNITATTGTIGGFTIGSDFIRDAANSFGLASTVTGGDDVRFWAGDTYVNRSTAPFRVTEAGVVTGTSATFTGTLNATGGYIGSTTALVYESTGINTGTTGHIRGSQTDYDTGTGYFLGYSGGAYKLSIGIGGSTTNNLTWNGTTLTVNGYVISNKGVFGGDGSDGALTITSGTTTIDLGNAALVTKNYTSISITGTGKLAFSNPNTSGTQIILKSTGNITITSSATCIDCSSLGAAGGSGGAGSTGTGASGSQGTAGSFILDTSNHAGSGGTGGQSGGAGAGAGGVILVEPRNLYSVTQSSNFSRRGLFMACGSGGGGGSGGSGPNGAPTNGGAGGTGGGALYIECAGAWNFTTSAGINVSGGAGVAGGAGGADPAGLGGGGGGGSAGMCVVYYNTLTANSGTVTNNSGIGGAGGSLVLTNQAGGTCHSGAGGGGGGLFAAGGAGGNRVANDTNGAAGNAGASGSGGGGGGGASASNNNGTYTGGAGGAVSAQASVVTSA